MKRELMITAYEGHLCACYYEDEKLTELNLLPSKEHTERTVLGNIYVGRIQNIVRNLDAAFVEIQPGVNCYYSLKENRHLFLNPKLNSKPVIGDEILVQVTKDAIKTKAPLCDAQLRMSGRLVVVMLGNGTVHISRKLPRDEKTEMIRTGLKALLAEKAQKTYDIVVRTSAYESTAEDVQKECRELLAKLEEIQAHAACHKVYSCLYRERTPLMQLMDDYNGESLDRIVTDLPVIQEELQTYAKAKAITVKTDLYKPELQPLYAVYRLDRDWKELTVSRVWLKSGAYLVIEQTEAMVVIDVNTGKAVNKKEKQAHFLKVNQEAASEIARQLRLRNLSGIIMIDFIDMEQAENRQSLVEHFQREIRKDRIPTSYIEMTKLNLVELTRKKVKPSLIEQIRLDNQE